MSGGYYLDQRPSSPTIESPQFYQPSSHQALSLSIPLGVQSPPFHMGWKSNICMLSSHRTSPSCFRPSGGGGRNKIASLAFFAAHRCWLLWYWMRVKHLCVCVLQCYSFHPFPLQVDSLFLGRRAWDLHISTIQRAVINGKGCLSIIYQVLERLIFRQALLFATYTNTSK